MHPAVREIFIVDPDLTKPIKRETAFVIPEGFACIVDESGTSKNLPLVSSEDWFPTLEQAVNHCERRREAVIAIYEDKIAALARLDFGLADA